MKDYPGRRGESGMNFARNIEMFALLAVVGEWRGPSVVVVGGRVLLRPSRRVVMCCDYTRASAVSQVVGLTS